MISTRRALFAVFVTAVTSTALHTQFEKARIHALKKSHIKDINETWNNAFSTGWESCSNDFSTINRRYHEFINPN